MAEPLVHVPTSSEPVGCRPPDTAAGFDEASALAERLSLLASEFCGTTGPHVLDRLRARRRGARGYDRIALARAAGLDDAALLARLCGDETHDEAIAALALVPLVVVAWADHVVSPAERGAILDVAEELSIERGSPLFHLLGRWLLRRPTEALVDAWSAYVGALCAVLPVRERRRLARRILSHARRVAKAGIPAMRFRRRISRRAERALARLARSFEDHGASSRR